MPTYLGARHRSLAVPAADRGVAAAVVDAAVTHPGAAEDVADRVVDGALLLVTLIDVAREVLAVLPADGVHGELRPLLTSLANRAEDLERIRLGPDLVGGTPQERIAEDFGALRSVARPLAQVLDRTLRRTRLGSEVDPSWRGVADCTVREVRRLFAPFDAAAPRPLDDAGAAFAPRLPGRDAVSAAP